ncbi:type II toxin-antitoxin system CcdA family antitoxin [Halorubrum ezzemoulense]|uniref:type II toxin-antitoxin system CcdA family antitoxin n=1 Tax=Halorubrum ezzemoulense TaxID=337243 RepID=UPI0012BA5945|nr:type II toxin-antitoxin system CcdA family antitoxin [Halorubrum ezzemoulense]
MARRTVSVTMDEKLVKKAKNRDEINISAIAERALRDAMTQSDSFFVNSNRDTFSNEDVVGMEVVDHGVAAAYGNWDEFGYQLVNPTDSSTITPGDRIFLWVDEQGVRAEGRVIGTANDEPVIGDEQVYGGSQTEFHLPTRWYTVLDEDDAVSNKELKQVLGRGNPRGTVHPIDSKHNVQRLLEVMRGRVSNLP